QRRPPSHRSIAIPIVQPYRKRLQQGPTTTLPAPTKSNNPHRGQIPIEPVAPPAPNLPAISCLGASRTPAVAARRWVRHPGVRETCTRTDAGFAPESAYGESHVSL